MYWLCTNRSVVKLTCFRFQLLTKAYEFFKAHKTKNMTFYVASQIALAHYEGGNYDMALK